MTKTSIGLGEGQPNLDLCRQYHNFRLHFRRRIRRRVWCSRVSFSMARTGILVAVLALLACRMGAAPTLLVVSHLQYINLTVSCWKVMQLHCCPPV